MLTYACSGCHGINGASAGPAMPSLASQSKQAIVAAMQKFRSGERPSTIMGGLAKGYSDAQFAAIGEFFAAQKLHAPRQTLDTRRVLEGASLHETNCARCHMSDGREGKDDAPAIAGQWLPYLQMQMALYLSGMRKMPVQMEQKVQLLSVEELESLLHFYASVQ